ncbi:arginyl-tRNA synthetase [Crocosphaera sp. XPORK-15E]|uniref:arginyl-tRNA synthetase n=1 Tax=Crocosphaera sp. XPORK-15E TaxID=3110247 RepID=UPI002B1FBFF8|nr:arginyl-tRNA synthetase [Crocosphaera sp. XPORK-15E]MEA5536563.1 arginyl-tRNA synthetase [Crocosphaera sp. XPORK-15E]
MIITDVSPQRQLQQSLETILTPWDRLKVPGFELRRDTVSLFRLPHLNTITYRCAIAVQLASQFSVSPLTLAEEILKVIEGQVSSFSFTVELVAPGWLHFELSDRSLAHWLQNLATFPWPVKNSPLMSVNHNNLFPLEYAQTRCGALLRLGEQERIIQLNNGLFEPNFRSLKHPQMIPWYDVAKEQLRLSDPVERSLIFQLVTTMDRLVNESSVDEIKLANHLSESFLKFDRYCRIFGETAQVNTELSQVRLGLVALTQYVLKGLWLCQIEQPPRPQL